MMASKQSVFLSYDREQKVVEFAIKLKNDLEGKGLDIWFDQDTLEPELDISDQHDQSFHQMTREGALVTCRGLIALFTKAYVSSKYCEEEFFAARNQRKRIFPVVYEQGWNTDSHSQSAKVMYAISVMHIEWSMFRPSVDDFATSLEILVRSMMRSLALPLPDERPTLFQLQLMKAANGTELRIIQDSASKWKNLAIALKFGGPKIESIEQGNHFQPEECCLKVLMKWLDGGRNLYSPISWDSLSHCLKNAGLYSLFSRLEDLLGLHDQGSGDRGQIEETDNQENSSMEDISDQIEMLTTRFRSLAQKTREELKENKTRLDDFCDTVTNMPPQIRQEHEKYLDEKLGCMLKARNLDEILLRFNLYWSFIDYSLLEYIIRCFGSLQLRQEMAKYVDDLSGFRRQTTLHQMIECWDCECMEPPRKFLKLTSKIAIQNVYECKLETVEELRRKFCREFSLSKCFMMFRYVIEGSVNIIWMVPSILGPGLADEIHKKPRSTEFFHENDIVELTLDGEILFSSQRPSYSKEYSEEVIFGLSLEQIQEEIESKLTSSGNGAPFTQLPRVEEENQWTLHIRKLNGKVISISCNETDTIADVKSTIYEAEGLPLANQCLVMRKRRESPLPEVEEEKSSAEGDSQTISTVILEDDSTLISYGIKNGQELILEPVHSQFNHSQSISTIDYVNIRMVSGSIFFSVPVEKNMSIELLKVRIKEIAILSETTQELSAPDIALRLIFRGEELKGPQTMKMCGIHTGAIIHLVKVKLDVLHIQTAYKTLHIDCIVSDTVADLKVKIEEMESTPFEEQNLIFLGRVLEDDRKSLSEYNIQLGDTVHLAYKTGKEGYSSQPQSLSSKIEDEPIFVKTLTGRVLHLDVRNINKTVANLKLMIQAEDLISPQEQHLVFDSVVLEDDSKTLSDYNINLGDTLNLSYRQSATVKKQPKTRQSDSAQLTSVYVKGSYGDPLKIAVGCSNTVADVKVKVHQLREEMGLPEEQELIFLGKKLKNDQKLCESGIKDGSVLHLRLGRGKLREITVKSFTSASDNITLSVTPEDTFADIKRKIYEQKSILPEMQKLLYGGDERDDSCSLGDLNMQNRSILYLEIMEMPKITIKPLSGKDITLDFNPESTIAVVKAQIQEQKRIPTDCLTLIFKGKFLKQDEKTLSECGISVSESTLYMYHDSVLLIKIPSLQKTVRLEFNPEMTIRDLKDELFEQDSRIVREKCSLVFNGVHLDEESTIGQYNIPTDDRVLDLVIVDKEQMSLVGPVIEEVD